MRLAALAFVLVSCATRLAGQDKPISADSEARLIAAFDSSLGHVSGPVTLKGDLATLNVPSTWRYLDEKRARRLLVDGWGNPKSVAEGLIAILVPADVGPLSEAGWGVTIRYDEDGYVSDKDAATINYDDLLKDMQKNIEEANPDRVKEGYTEMHLVGWAEAPSYDSAAHKMYWAKELHFAESKENTLNYSIRILGRKGVLTVDAVGSMSQLAMIKQSMPTVMGFIDFNAGSRYTDHVSGDKVAEYGIAGLVAGTIAAKAGFFKLLIAGLLAAKKAILLLFVAASAWLRKMWGRLRGKKAEEGASAPPAGGAPAA